jgi:hypothetical protein
MKREEFELLCHAVKSGDAKFVENMKWRYTGKVVACKTDKVEVEAFGHRFGWPVELCREKKGDDFPLGPPSSK